MQLNLIYSVLTQFTPPGWCQRVNVLADAGFAAKATLQGITTLGYFYTFALPRTWKTAAGRHLRDIARHTNKRYYHRVASYQPDGRRRDYWTIREAIKLTALGDVTLVISKRRFNDPPRNIKFLVTNLPDASTGLILSYYARRWAVEVTFKELKSGLHLGQMQVTRGAYSTQHRLTRHGLCAVTTEVRDGVTTGTTHQLLCLAETLSYGGLSGAIRPQRGTFQKKLAQLKQAI